MSRTRKSKRREIIQKYELRPVPVTAIRFEDDLSAGVILSSLDDERNQYIYMGQEHYLRDSDPYKNAEIDRSTGSTLDRAPSFLSIYVDPEPGKKPVRMDHGDWLVFDDGAISIWSDKDFNERYQPRTTRVVLDPNKVRSVSDATAPMREARRPIRDIPQA